MLAVKLKSGEVLYYHSNEDGSLLNDADNILDYSDDKLRKFRWKQVSMILQSAQNALNPLMTIYEHFWETYAIHNPSAKEDKVMGRFRQLLDDVRLDPDRVLSLYPHELSGGMKQRVMIAFSMLLEPRVIILDEPTTALDVIIQDYIFSILDKIHIETDISMLLLTHDIGVVAKVADRIAVMYAGRIVEVGDIFTVFKNTGHPYSDALIKTAPSLFDVGNDKEPIFGSPPDLISLPSGCSFHPRCLYAKDICKESIPPLVKIGEDHMAACHFSDSFREEVQNDGE